MAFWVREVGKKTPFHSIPYQFERDAIGRKDELNRWEARKEDGTVYEVVSDVRLSSEEDRAWKYRGEDD